MANVPSWMMSGDDQAPQGGGGYLPQTMPGQAWSSMYGMPINGLPDIVAGAGGPANQNLAPTYRLGGFGDSGSQEYDPMLAATIKSGDAGAIRRGASAFMSTPLLDNEFSGSDMGYTAAQNQGGFLEGLRQTAGALGMDTSKYSNSVNGLPSWITSRQVNTDGSARPQELSNANAMWNDMDELTKDYYSVSGMSNGWDGSGNARSASRTLYRNVDGTLMPVSTPQHYMAAENPGWIKGDGADTIAALSMMMPAFGGWAGMLGQGTAGTLSAGSGLGLTTGLSGAIGTGATNALVNAGMNAALTGSGTQGFLGSLGSSALGAAGNSLMGNSGGLGSMFSTANPGVSQLNPQQYMNQALNATGLQGSPLGLAQGVFGGLGQNGVNANTLRTLAGSLGGNYVGRQIDPRLGGAGAQAGRSLAQLMNGY